MSSSLYDIQRQERSTLKLGCSDVPTQENSNFSQIGQCNKSSVAPRLYGGVKDEQVLSHLSTLNCPHLLPAQLRDDVEDFVRRRNHYSLSQPYASGLEEVGQKPSWDIVEARMDDSTKADHLHQTSRLFAAMYSRIKYKDNSSFQRQSESMIRECCRAPRDDEFGHHQQRREEELLNRVDGFLGYLSTLS